MPTLTYKGQELERVDSWKAVGVRMASGRGHLLREHVHEQRKKAQKVLNILFTLERHIGVLPVQLAVNLYKAQVDPHLTFGCEVRPDTLKLLYEPLEDVRVAFLRRALPVSTRTSREALLLLVGETP